MSQGVRDLLWVVNSPSFVVGDQVAPHIGLLEEQIDAVRLEQFLAERPVHRVGRYFENLLHFWLREVRRVEMIGAGMQIRDGKRTIGELDFVYRDESGVMVHCEAAVKFFLHHRREGVSHFPGPNASDNFERKAAKLFDQQLQFSKVHRPDVELRHAFVKGIVFYRGDERPDELPYRMAPDHLTGSWLRASELDQLAARSDVTCMVADKPHWLGSHASAPRHQPPVLVEKLRRHFADPDAHPLLVSLRDNSTGAEVDRLFVVSQRWPN